MITVIHIITRLELGGAQENTLYTCRGLDRGRFRVVLIYGPGGLLDAELPDTGALRSIPLASLRRELSPLDDGRAARALTALLRRLATEHEAQGGAPGDLIVHTHSSKAGVLGRLAAARAGIPHIVHGIHGFGFFPGQPALKRALFLQAERLAARVTEAFVSVSEANLAEAQALGIVRPHHRALVVRSGMELEPLLAAREAREAKRAELGLPEDAELLLSVANFKPQKDPLTLMAAFTQLAARRPKAVLLLAGDGPLRPAAEAALAEAGLSARARFLGWRRDIPELIAASDLVCLSSRFEGLPRVAVQAAAVGRPFVGTRVDGSAEIIKNGRNGYLVEPEQPGELAAALEAGLALEPEPTSVADWGLAPMVAGQTALYLELCGEG